MMLINGLIPVITVKISVIIGKFKDELGGLIMSEFYAHRTKIYAYKLGNNDEVKKAKGTKKCVI